MTVLDTIRARAGDAPVRLGLILGSGLGHLADAVEGVGLDYADLPGFPHAGVSGHRPRLVIGFAAETEQVVANAMTKRARKGCDWIVANDVSTGTGTFGGAENTVTLITDSGAESWPRMAKDAVARQLAARIAEALT